MNYMTDKWELSRLFGRLRPWVRRLLALCLALSICSGLLLTPAAAEDIHPPEESSSEFETQTPPIQAPEPSEPYETQSPPIQPQEPSTESPIIPAPSETSPVPGGSEPDPTNPGTTDFPVTPSESAEVPEVTEVEPPLVVAEANVTPHSGEPVSQGTPVSNTYIFEVSTGTVKGGGYAETLEYFVIYYTAGGKSRSAVIFPNFDGISRSVERASAVGNRNQRRKDVKNIFGYEIKDPSELNGLRSVKTDQFLFTTPYQITTVDRIQLFGRKQDIMNEDGNGFVKASDWACQGMRIYEVTKLYGEDIYGWYTEDGYIDFDGHIIADVDMSSGGGTFRWNSNGGVFNILPPDNRNGVAGCKLINTAIAQSYSGNTHVGEDHISQATNRILFQFSLADFGGAGFECLAGSYNSGANTKISESGFCETATLTIRYEDVFGCLRDLDIPMIVNSLGWAVEVLGDAQICGFAQQGDTIGFSAMLPDFSNLTSAKLVIGEEEAREKAHMRTATDGSVGSLHNSRCQRSESDGISYLCIAAYSAGSATLTVEGATLRCKFIPGAQNPIRYYNSGGTNGLGIEPKSSVTFSLGNYHDNMVLTPVDRSEKYLITICTDNVDNAGTTADIYLQFKYVNMKDKEVTSAEYRLRDYVEQFYGEWPGNGPNFAYEYGLRSEGTVQAMIPLSNVKQFKTISIRLDGEDEWQFKGLVMHKVRSYDSRILRWKEIDVGGFKSHVLVTRTVVPEKEVFSLGTIYDGSPIVKPTDDNWKPGTLIQDDNTYHEYDGHSTEVDARDEIDWETIRLFMTYEDALQDLNFTKQRCLYQIEVGVAGDKVNEDDDDCGSENLFYFQLVFDYGNSGCVLANQQLQSDSFRTGAPAIFYIPTAQDYGDLHSIRIIPDDQDDNSHIYDKLKISYITVRKQNVGKISPVWTAASDSKDGLGWVGIDPRDSGAAGSYRGAEGRSILELAHSYQITQSTYSTKLLFSITTGAYGSQPATGRDGVTEMINDKNLVAGMSMSLSYKKQDGLTKPVDPFDIVTLMNQYSGLSDNKVFTVDGESKDVGFAVSDAKYQFRPGKTDSFFVDVDDIAELLDAQIQIRSTVNTKWNVTSLTVHQVQASGTRYINNNGEYDYKYPDGKELIYKASWNFTEPLTRDVQIYDTHTDEHVATIDLHFTENEFEAYDAEGWESTVSREPPSKDDMLNLYIFPSTESAATDFNNYDMFATVLYTDSKYRQSQSITTSGGMLRTTDSSGRPCFYALGLNANYLDSISGVNVFTQCERPVHAPISYAILQRIRSGVLIDSYYLTGAGNADQGITLHVSSEPGGRNTQRLFLQFSEEMDTQFLTAEERDLAMALYFTTDDAYGGELRSKYITLTDAGITEIKPGQVVELDFNILNLKDVTGVALVNMGRLEESIDNIVVIEQKTDGTVRTKWSFRRGQQPIVPTRVPGRVDPSGDVTLLDLDISTAQNNGSFNTGTTGPVKMTVGFFTREGGEGTYTFDNIRDLADSTSPFRAGQTDHVRVLVPDAVSIRWVEFEPLNGTDGTNAIWQIDKVSCTTDLSGLPLTRILEDNNVCRPGEPKRVSLAQVMLGGILSYIYNENDTGIPNGDEVIPTGGYLELSLEVGQGVNIVPRIEGSDAGLDVKLNRVDSTGGLLQANLVDTRGYTRDMVIQYAQSAEERGNTNEAEFWRNFVIDDGYYFVERSSDPVTQSNYVDSIRFIPPHNYTSSVIYYRITITSTENEAATIYVNLIVPSEPDPTQQQLAEARAKDSGQSVGHTHSIVKIDRVEPTCMQEGNILYYSCAGCQKYFSDSLGQNEIPDLEMTVLAALGHSWSGWNVTVVPTCTMEGSRTRNCTRCGETETETLPPSGHTWGEWTSNENGTHARTCSVCGKSESSVSCTFQDTVVPPTATEQGYTIHTCTVCGYSYRDNYTDPLPSEPAPTNAVRPEPDPAMAAPKLRRHIYG